MTKAKNYYGLADELPKTDKRQAKWKEQRRKQGFDDTETWAFDSTCTSFILPRLTRFRELTNGVPFGIEGNTLEEREANWKKILDQMIEGFQLHTRRDGFDLTKKEYAKIFRGLKLFSKYYFNLWW